MAIRKARDAAFLSVPAIMLAAPVFADSLSGTGIEIPKGFDGNSAIVVLALYIIREQFVRVARIAESLASSNREKREVE